MEIFDLFRDEDEDLLEFIEYHRRPYIVRERLNPFESLDEQDFFVRFRLHKETVLNLLEEIEHRLEFPTDRNHAVTPINQLLLTLRYFATGSFLIAAGDYIHVSKSSACNYVRNVSQAIALLAPRYIKFPEDEAEIREKQVGFYAKASLPRIIGSLDCTHIKIQSPGGEHAEVYRNRKGYFSINVQTVSDVNLKIMDIVARWPGSTHDQTIFDNANIKHRFQNNEFGNGLLVADSGYANTLHVTTPLLNPQGEIQQLYNESITRTRNPVERQYGVWKRRFPLLAMGIRQRLENILPVIVACAVLHNLALKNCEDEPPLDPDLNHDLINYQDDIAVDAPEHNNLQTARDFLLLEYFPALIRNRR